MRDVFFRPPELIRTSSEAPSSHLERPLNFALKPHPPRPTFVLHRSHRPPEIIRFCGIPAHRFQRDDSNVDRLREAAQGELLMHDLLIALAFIGMIIAPALVAAKSGGSAAAEESE